ncbi:hypothetical protein ACHAXR_006022 [Thalassiosira sp. AJA248-18]
MAWRSSGTNNTEMVDKLKRFGVITSDHVEEGFREVDRKFFVPRGNESMAHSDQPLKEGNVHISAPHIYGSAIQALDLVPNSSISFLNVGSGTGYISCIAAEILGPNSLNYGVELHDDVIEHCKASIDKWKTNTVEERDGISTFHFMDSTADIQIIKGNGLNILKTKGESVVGFDRIYIGAAVDKEDLANITKLLSPGGILVGPVDDELVKVVRVGNISFELEDDQAEDDNLPGLDEEFTSQILSGVRFAPLAMSPVVNTIIPAKVWNPLIQCGYPTEFQRASMQLLMCSNSEIIQPLPPVPIQEGRFNAAAMLPKSIWLEILSYTHRKWFVPEQNETDYLKRRLREEKAKTAKAEKARREAEERCLAAERERAVYRLLSRRWQARLNLLLSQQDRQDENARQQDEAAEEVSDLLDLAGGAQNNDNAAVRFENRSTLSGLRAMLQQLSGDDALNEDDDSEEEEADVDNMEEDDTGENQDHDDDLLDFLEDENESDADEFFVPAVEEDSDENDSVVMEDVDDALAKGQRAADQPRTVSMSSDDL